MRVLHVNNHHRGVGGSDAACKGTIKTCMERGLDVGVFARDSRDLPADQIVAQCRMVPSWASRTGANSTGTLPRCTTTSSVSGMTITRCPS